MLVLRMHPAAGERPQLRQLPDPRLLFLRPYRIRGGHFHAKVLSDGIRSLLDDFHRGANKRIPLGPELAELGQATDGLGEDADSIVADVELGEGDEEADGVRNRGEELEVLADVQGLEADEVFESVGEGSEAVEAGVEVFEGRHVRSGVREERELVRIHGEPFEVCELEPDGVRELREFVEVHVQLLESPVRELRHV